MPIVKVLKENFELIQGFMTTVHAYTNNQALLDSEHKDPRRGRAAAVNIIPTSTGADKVITKIYPELESRIQSSAIRVPVPLGSIVKFTFVANKKITVDEVNAAFKKASENELAGILDYCEVPLVSSDFIGSPYSCIFDSLLTRTQSCVDAKPCVNAHNCVKPQPCINASSTMGKVAGWYDNEYGYSCRLRDFLIFALSSQ